MTDNLDDSVPPPLPPAAVYQETEESSKSARRDAVEGATATTSGDKRDVNGAGDGCGELGGSSVVTIETSSVPENTAGGRGTSRRRSKRKRREARVSNGDVDKDRACSTSGENTGSAVAKKPSSSTEETKTSGRKRRRPDNAEATDTATKDEHEMTPFETRHNFVFESDGELGMSVKETASGGCLISRVAFKGMARRLGVHKNDVIVSVRHDGDDAGGSGACATNDRRARMEPNEGECGNGTQPTGDGSRQVVPAVTFDHFVKVSHRRPLHVTVTRVHHLSNFDDANVSESKRRKDRAIRESQRLRDATTARDVAVREKSHSDTELAAARLAFDRAKERLDAAVERNEADARRLREATSLLRREAVLQARPPWNVMFEQLCEFKEKHGHTWVGPAPKTGYRKRGRRNKGDSEESPTHAEAAVDSTITEDEDDDGLYGEDDDEDEEKGEGDGKAAAPEDGEGAPTDESTRRSLLADKKFRLWTERQRRYYRLYEKMDEKERADFSARMTSDQFQQLKDIGLILSHSDYTDGAKWDRMYEQLAAFRLEFGHIKVPKRRDGKFEQLTQWVARQQKLFEEGTLSEEKMEKLDKLGFVYVKEIPRKRVSWQEMFRRLQAFKEEHGHCNVPFGWKEDKELALWVSGQRSKCTIQQPDRYRALQELGFCWSMREVKWNQWMARLIAYKNEFGDCNVSRAPGPHYDLAHWCQKLRNQYTLLQDGKHSELTAERLLSLEALGFQWRLRSERPREATARTEEEVWNERYQEAKEFKEKHGHCRIQSRHCRCKSRLRVWATQQREQFRAFQEGRSTKMTKQRIELLEQLGFEWTRSQESYFVDPFATSNW